jgi:phosphopantetheine--protein transferase-like protein
MCIVESGKAVGMILGIGTDLLYLGSITDTSLEKGDPFYEKMYTEKEKLQAEESACRGEYLRRRFAGKEAVFKCLGEDPDEARICEIEILDDGKGAPYVTLHGMLKLRAENRGIRQVLISLSSEKEYAAAFAIAQT